MNEMNEMRILSTSKLKERGVEIEDIAQLVLEIQLPYNDSLTLEHCIKTVNDVLGKREVTYAILTGIALDKAVEEGKLDNEINKVIKDDEGLYGIDEILALSIVNTYGSIALTNFGYLDKTKPGIIGEVDKKGKRKEGCYTFLDDIISAIASAAGSKIAHEKKDIEKI